MLLMHVSKQVVNGVDVFLNLKCYNKIIHFMFSLL